MSRTTRAILCLALALPMSIGASASLAQSPQPYPLGTEIPLTQMAGTAVAPDAGITITFAADATLSGFDGCNQYSASWQSDGTTLTVGPIAATRTSCTAAVKALESQYLGLLQDAKSWSLNGTAVVVVTTDGPTLVFAGPPASAAIAGSWALSSVDGTPVAAGIAATAIFGTDGSLTGSGGCNTFDGTYTVDGANLTVGPLAATRKFCESSSQLESAYLDALQGATGWAVAGSTLTLTGTSTLIFGNGSASAATLSGQPWSLVTMGGQTVDPSLGVSATFADDGTVTGSGGCNTYSATYTVSGDTLAIGPVAATRTTCATHVNDTESAFFTALEGAATFAINGADLTITAKDGSTLEFQVQGGPPPSPAASAAATAEPTAAASPAGTAAATAEPSPGDSPAATGGIVGSWNMTEFVGASTDILPGFKASIAFAADGTFTGFAGCNDFSGTYALTGTTIALSGIDHASTGTCDSVSQQFEASFFQLVPLLNTATITDGKLVLSGAMMSGQGVTYEAAP